LDLALQLSINRYLGAARGDTRGHDTAVRLVGLVVCVRPADAACWSRRHWPARAMRSSPRSRSSYRRGPTSSGGDRATPSSPVSQRRRRRRSPAGRTLLPRSQQGQSSRVIWPVGLHRHHTMNSKPNALAVESAAAATEHPVRQAKVGPLCSATSVANERARVSGHTCHFTHTARQYQAQGCRCIECPCRRFDGKTAGRRGAAYLRTRWGSLRSGCRECKAGAGPPASAGPCCRSWGRPRPPMAVR
jgi:hypothetical protein